MKIYVWQKFSEGSSYHYYNEVCFHLSPKWASAKHIRTPPPPPPPPWRTCFCLMSGTGNPQSILVNLLGNPSQVMKFLLEIQGEFIISSGNPHLHLRNNKIDWKSEIFSGHRQFVLEIQVSCQNIY